MENDIFQDLGSFGKGTFFKMVMEYFCIFVWKNSKYVLKWMQLSVVLNTVYDMFAHSIIY